MQPTAEAACTACSATCRGRGAARTRLPLQQDGYSSPAPRCRSHLGSRHRDECTPAAAAAHTVPVQCDRPTGRAYNTRRCVHAARPNNCAKKLVVPTHTALGIGAPGHPRASFFPLARMAAERGTAGEPEMLRILTLHHAHCQQPKRPAIHAAQQLSCKACHCTHAARQDSGARRPPSPCALSTPHTALDVVRPSRVRSLAWQPKPSPYGRRHPKRSAP